MLLGRVLAVRSRFQDGDALFELARGARRQPPHDLGLDVDLLGPVAKLVGRRRVAQRDEALDLG